VGGTLAKIRVVLNRQDLGFAGRSYLRSYLEANGGCRKHFGPLLIKRHHIHAGRLWAYVPSPLPSSRRAPLTDFESGGLCPKSDAEWEQRFGDWLASLEHAGATHVCLEGAYERPADGFLETYERPVFFCGESVIFYSSLRNSTLTPGLRLGGATWRPDITIIGSTTELPADRETVQPIDVARLVESTLAVVMGAWDDEGLIFWEPERAAS
jgi:hypothetical protein